MSPERRASKRMVTPTTCHHPPFTFSFSSGVRVLIIAVIMKCLLSYTIAVTCYSRLCHVRNFTYLSVAFNNKWNSERLSKSTNKIWETHSIRRIFSICKLLPKSEYFSHVAVISTGMYRYYYTVASLKYLT